MSAQACAVSADLRRHQDDIDRLSEITERATAEANAELKRNPDAYLDGYEDRSADVLADMLLDLLHPERKLFSPESTRQAGHAALDNLRAVFQEEWIAAQVAKAIEDAS